MAKKRGATITRLLDEMTTLLLAEFDIETRYKAQVEGGLGKADRGLALFEKSRS